jgi:hypothetical protein
MIVNDELGICGNNQGLFKELSQTLYGQQQLKYKNSRATVTRSCSHILTPFLLHPLNEPVYNYISLRCIVITVCASYSGGPEFESRL